MKKTLIIALFAGSIFATSCQPEVKKVEVKSSDDSLAYAIGSDIANGFEQSKLENLNPDIVALAIKNHFAKDSSVMSADDIKNVMMAFSNKRRKEQQAKQDELSQVNIKEGEAFLAANKVKEGVITTESGLQYKVITAGNGAIPTADDKVKVHYTGKLINGTVFDSSVERGQPAEFPVKGVIPGWTEVLQLMKTGAKYEVYIPSALAYGPRGQGQQIAPHSTLIFDVELLSIEK